MNLIKIGVVTSDQDPHQDLPITVYIGYFGAICLSQADGLESNNTEMIAVSPDYIDRLCETLQVAKTYVKDRT